MFIDLYQQLKWLNAYSVINGLAMQKILKKFIKENFEIKDNVIDKNIKEMLAQLSFSKRDQLHFAIDDMLEFFAAHFSKDGNKETSKRLLERHNTEMRRKDAILIAFFLGVSTVLVLMGTFFLIVGGSDE